MNIEIGAYDADGRTVPVTFTSGDIAHNRSVNAVHDENGDYDADATALRVEEVARGVEVKIGLGVIKAAPVEAESEAEPEQSEEPAEDPAD